MLVSLDTEKAAEDFGWLANGAMNDHLVGSNLWNDLVKQNRFSFSLEMSEGEERLYRERGCAKRL